jgi:hypothetical protein
LEKWLGDWTYVRETKATPLRILEGKFVGKYTGKAILNGFFVEFQHEYKGPSGEVQWIEIDGYDAAAGNYVYSWYGSYGHMGRGTFVITENGNTWEGTRVAGSKQYMERGSTIFAPDGMSYIKKAEISSDGKTWEPYYELKATKVKSLPK